LLQLRTLGWLVSLGLVTASPEVITFDSAPLGKLPPGWTTAANQAATANWEILKDATARSQPYVLGQVPVGASGSMFPMAILDRASLRDGEVSVRLKPVAGKEDRAGGVVWRYLDPQNYCLARVNALENNISIYRVHNGKWTLLPQKGKPRTTAGVRHEIPTGAWATLRVVFRGPNVVLFYNHRRLLQAEDLAPGAPGKIGLWTKADSITYFDDFRYVAR
jgi:hypothetical protein